MSWLSELTQILVMQSYHFLRRKERVEKFNKLLVKSSRPHTLLNQVTFAAPDLE